MALTEQTRWVVSVLDDGQLECRRSRQVFDGPEMLGQTHYRQVFEPGEVIASLPVRVRVIATAVWTPAVVTAYLAAKAAANGSV